MFGHSPPSQVTKNYNFLEAENVFFSGGGESIALSIRPLRVGSIFSRFT
jgi:hypothetical protein